MKPQVELGLLVEFDELFSLRERIRSIADQVRAKMVAGGLQDPLEPEVFETGELELRGTEGSRFFLRLDSYHLEIGGAPPELQIHLLSALILEEAGVFRLTSVEAAFAATFQAGEGRPLNLIEPAFGPLVESGTEALDRRFSMTWDWGNATTGYSLHASDTEDREMFVSFKAREGYMNLPELQAGAWMNEQAARFDQALSRLLTHLGWKL